VNEVASGPQAGLTRVDSAFAAPTVRAAHRGRLFRRYLLLILTLVTIALLASGAISVYFTYQETKAALASLQHEKALAAGSRIEQYMLQIERQLGYAALPQIDAGNVELRRIEFLKLLRQAPEVTDVAQLDAAGRERIAVSRLGMDSIGSGRDRSQEPAFREAKAGRAWFGPVYFRKETEPYMTIALRSAGDNGAVTLADVNLKFIWDVVSRIRIGDKGKAYVVDDNGYLVADPDIGLVLRKTNLSRLPHVKAAAAPRGDAELAMVSTDLAGTRVLTSVAPIGSLKWNVFVEQPVSEVYAKLNASILRTALLLLAGLALSALGALALARGMVRPIRTLEAGAQRIGAGDLDQRIDIRTGDELEALANQFNRMSGQLRESYAGLEQKVEARTHDLANALEQQTAISEILRVISSSPTDVRPVLDAVAQRAARLCEATVASVLLREGQVLRPMSAYSADGGAAPTYDYVVPLRRTFVTGRAALDRATVAVADIVPLLENEFRDARENQQALGFRAVLGVPLVREEVAYGAIYLYRREPRAFSGEQVALVETFARQAAIAIDNVRLFNETKDALERQTAMSEILRVISSSPTDVQPVFDIISERALKLCDAEVSVVARLDGDVIRLGAYRGLAAQGHAAMERAFPMRLDVNTIAARTIRERRIVEVDDVLDDPGYEGREAATSGHFRGSLGVPMLREGEVIGSIFVAHRNPGRFSEARIELLKTFADQGAIAIENVRLFNETKDALEQQTAISEILRVIPTSPADVQPVLDAIAERAARLCDASAASIYLLDGDVLRHLASKGPSPDPVNHVDTLAIDDQTVSGRAFLERRAIQIDDMLAEGRDYPVSFALAQRFEHRTVLVIPLLREGQPFGTILLRRREVRPFGERESALLQTFGDQAAIALENVRLFNETKEALEQQRASADVLAAISSSIADTAPVFDKIISSAERLFAGRVVAINLVGDDGRIRIAAYRGPGREKLEHAAFVAAEGATGESIARRDVLRFPDVLHDADAPAALRYGAEVSGMKAAMIAPMIWEDAGVGAIVVGRDHVGSFSEKDAALLKTFADQAVIAIQNARLFHEIEDKSRELEIANKHKSEFLASMSHELRTPLNAIIGFSEVLLERLFGEINEKQDDYLKDIHSSGKHLLSLINDILDLSKIEAGRMELDTSRFDVAGAISNALTLVRERAQQHGIVLAQDVDPSFGAIVADERKFRQILLNLLSNAVKFTPDGGRIEVSARRTGDGAEFAVRDSGIGIAPDDHAAVFEEFRQVGGDYTKKQEGTGLGLALTRKFVELHGGRIRLESAPGAGSTFTFTIPSAT